MWRYVRALIAVMSLLLSVAAFWLGVRSRWTYDGVLDAVRGGHYVRVDSQFGRLTLTIADASPITRRVEYVDRSGPLLDLDGIISPNDYTQPAYDYQDPPRPLNPRVFWQVRHLAVAAWAGVPFALWFSAQAMSFGRRRWRRSHGLCLRCGYDLRASIERCPECGMVFLAREGDWNQQ